MNPYKAYQQNRAAGQTRIDIILSLYDEVTGRIEKALAAQEQQDHAAVKRQLAASNLGVAGLANALNANGGEMAVNFLRLYDFVVRCLAEQSAAKLKAALDVLHTLREAFATIRPQAVAMERAGEIPPLDLVSSFQAKA
jgi:flagellar biosynthetic protein FliS